MQELFEELEALQQQEESNLTVEGKKRLEWLKDQIEKEKEQSS